MPDNPVILLFIKAPLSGQVKSRLAAVLGQDAALELYRNFVLDILASIEKSGVPCIICYHPPDSGEIVMNWLGGHLQCLPQEGRDLGERMERAFRRAFSEGASRAVLVGSDIRICRRNCSTMRSPRFRKTTRSSARLRTGGITLSVSEAKRSFLIFSAASHGAPISCFPGPCRSSNGRIKRSLCSPRGGTWIPSMT